jgi:ABC-type uncharacterized transport system substrate-binding protein
VICMPTNWKRSLAAAFLAALPAAAVAHPHMWVEMQSSILITSDGKVSGVRLTWTMDEGYSEAAVDGLDADGDETYSATELEALTKENLESLKTYDYFVHFRRGAEALPIAAAREATQSFADGRLTLSFTVPLQAATAAVPEPVSLKVYDPDFFIEFAYAGEMPVTAAAGAPANCKPDLKPVEATTETDLTREMLSTKDKDWAPETNEDFGSLFAPALVIACS